MSQGDSVVINELERALSTDINNLQAVDRSRWLADLYALASRYQSFDTINGTFADSFIDTIGAPLPVSGVLGNGFQVALPIFSPPVISFNVSAGTLVRFIPGAGPSQQDPNLFQVGRLKENINGITPGGAFGGQPIPPVAGATWLLCARIISDVPVVTEPRERFVPGTQQFQVENLVKLQEGQVELRLFDSSPTNHTYPGDEWHPIAIVYAQSGQIQRVTDCRQFVEPMHASPVDQTSVHWRTFNAGPTIPVIAEVELMFNGRRSGEAGNIGLNAFAQGVTRIADRGYSVWTYYMRRRGDGTLVRLPTLGGFGNFSVVITRSDSTEQTTNSVPIPLPNDDPWKQWYQGAEILTGHAFWIGSFLTEEDNADRYVPMDRSSRSLVRMGITAWQTVYGSYPNSGNSYSTVNQLNIVGGVVQNAPLTLPTQQNRLFQGIRPRAIRWRIALSFFPGVVRFKDLAVTDVLAAATFIIKRNDTKVYDASNVLYLGPLPVGPIYRPPALGIGANEYGLVGGTIEVWLPADVPEARVDIQIDSTNLPDPLFADDDFVTAYCTPIEWRF